MKKIMLSLAFITFFAAGELVSEAQGKKAPAQLQKEATWVTVAREAGISEATIKQWKTMTRAERRKAVGELPVAQREKHREVRQKYQSKRQGAQTAVKGQRGAAGSGVREAHWVKMARAIGISEAEITEWKKLDRAQIKQKLQELPAEQQQKMKEYRASQRAERGQTQKARKAVAKPRGTQ